MPDTLVGAADFSFDDWVAAPTTEHQRLGQHLMNTAPSHIYSAASGVMELDPFHVHSNDRMYIVNNFLLFAYVAWDLTDEAEILLARKMVMDEPGARR